MWQMRDNSLILLLIGFPLFIWLIYPEFHLYPHRDSDPAPVSPDKVYVEIENGEFTVDWKEVAWWRAYNVYLSHDENFTNARRLLDVKPPVKFADLEPGHAYHLAITSVNWSGESPLSSQTVVVLQAKQPSVFKVRGSSNSNILTWNKVEGANGYVLYWKKKGAPDSTRTPIFVSGKRTSYRHTGLENYREYEYQIEVQKMQYVTGISNKVVATPVAGPTDLKVESGDHEIFLSWKPAEKAKSYRVYFSDSPEFDIADSRPIIRRLRSNNLRITGLENGEVYYYAVTANTPLGESDRSNVIAVEPRINTPANLSVMVADDRHYLLWDPVPGAKKYRVYWSNNGDVDRLSSFFDVDANVPVVTHDHVRTGLSYFYRIAALDSNTESGLSAKAASIASRVYPPPGKYQSGQQVFLTCKNSAEKDCAVFYATADDEVRPYTDPIVLEESTTITYFAKDREGNVGPEQSAMYIVEGSGKKRSARQQLPDEPDKDSLIKASSI